MQPQEQSSEAASPAERPRRHSIHSTSPTTTDQLPLPEAAPADAAAVEPEPEVEEDQHAERADRPLESLESLYEAINTIPVQYNGYPVMHQPYYPIGGASHPSGGPPALEQWGSPPASRSLGQGMQGFAPSGAVGRGERRTGRCKFFNALKGFGFILDDRGEELGPNVEVFVHYSAIGAVQNGRGGFKSLLEDELVEYTIVQGPKGWQAQDVTGPNSVPVIGSPSTAPKAPPQGGYDRKFSVGSIGSDDFRFGAAQGSQRGRGSIGGTDSGYYSSAMTSPIHTPHQLYSPPQYPPYPHPSPHASFGPPPMGIPLALHHGNAYSFLPPPPPHHPMLVDGTSPPTMPIPLGDPAQNGQQDDRGASPYRPLPPTAFFQPGPQAYRQQGPVSTMSGYYGSPPGEGYYIPQMAYGFSPPFPAPLPLPTGVGAVGGYVEDSQEQGNEASSSEGEVAEGSKA